MYSLQAFRDDLILIYDKLQLSKDSNLENQYAEYLINKHRAAVIRETYLQSREIDPNVLQDMEVTEVENVLSSDDPSIMYGSSNLGKITTPRVVSMPDARGYYRVASVSNACLYEYIEIAKFMDLLNHYGHVYSSMKLFTQINNAIYIHPYSNHVKMNLILDNPLEGQIKFTEKVRTGNLVVGVSFTVTTGQIVHNFVTYNAGDTFIAVNRSFTGTGEVYYTTKIRSLTVTDPYPMSVEMMNKVTVSIFTREFQIEAKRVADVKNDAQDQLSVLQSGQS